MSILRCVESLRNGNGTCPDKQPQRCLPGSVPKLMSGAGHDALAIAEVAPIGMMFVRCEKGLSHTPLENATPADVATSAQALDRKSVV